MPIRKIFLLLRIGIFGFSVIPTITSASTSYATGTMTVSIVVSPSCNVSATGMNFGTYALTQLTATSTVSVTCTNGTEWSIALSTGNGSFTTRKMVSGSNSLNYNLYTSSLKTQVWGDGTGSSGVVSGTGTGAVQAETVYGTVPALQASTSGSYSDTITVTVSF